MGASVEICATAHDLAQAGAERIVTILNDAVTARGIASIALSGGSTPRVVYELLSSNDYKKRIEWNRVHIFWGDERCVPPYMPESNFRMANEAFIQDLSLPESHIHRIHAEHPPEEAAQRYEEELIQTFNLESGEWPEFDLFLLGIGEDGHTASLFPGSPALSETRRLVTSVYVPQVMAYRISLTLPVINNSSTVLVLVSGKTKAEIFKSIQNNDTAGLPVLMVRPATERLIWLVDRDAASLSEPVTYR